MGTPRGVKYLVGVLLTLNFVAYWSVPVAGMGMLYKYALACVGRPLADAVDNAPLLRALAAKYVYQKAQYSDYFAMSVATALSICAAFGVVLRAQLARGSLPWWLIFSYYCAWVGLGGRAMGTAYTMAHKEGHNAMIYQKWWRRTIGNLFENRLGVLYGNVPFNFQVHARPGAPRPPRPRRQERAASRAVQAAQCGVLAGARGLRGVLCGAEATGRRQPGVCGLRTQRQSWGVAASMRAPGEGEAEPRYPPSRSAGGQPSPSAPPRAAPSSVPRALPARVSTRLVRRRPPSYPQTSHVHIHHKLDGGVGDTFYAWDLDRASPSDFMLYLYRVLLHMTGISSLAFFDKTGR